MIQAVDVGTAISNGETVKLSGTDFGAKATAAPLIWQNFDDGEVGAELNSTGFWSIDSDNAEGLRPQFDDQVLRNGAGLNAFFQYPANPETPQRDIIYRQGLGISQGDKVFLSVWIRSSYPGPDQPSSKQWKIMRLSDGPYNSDTYPDLILSWNRNGFFSSYRDGVGDIIADCSDAYQVEYMSPPAANTWFNYMLQASFESGLSECDGSARVWYNGSLEMDMNNLQAMADETDTGWDEVWIGEYVQENAVDYEARFDDVYIDHSWARVEIGNANSYENCTHREIQIPQAWTSNEVLFKANQGSFPQDEPVFLYVVDENGLMNEEGYAVTFETESGNENSSNPTVSNDGCQSSGMLLSLFFLSVFLFLRRPQHLPQ